MKRWTRWQDWGSLLLGIVLFVSPWFLATASQASSAWNAWIVGILVALVALWALMQPDISVPQWLGIVLGAWLVIAPWMLGFAAIGAAAWTAWIIGILLIVLGALTMAQTRPLQAQSMS